VFAQAAPLESMLSSPSRVAGVADVEAASANGHHEGERQNEDTKEECEPDHRSGHAVEDRYANNFALQRVPLAARYHCRSMALENFSMCGCLSQVLLGTTLGQHMSFYSALVAVLLGSSMLAAMSVLVGIAGCREGLTTTMLSRWTGFGNAGSALLSFVIAVSLMGWFGIQSAIAGAGLESLCGGDRHRYGH